MKRTETAESVFGQDLNGDGTIGPTKTVIQTNGSTSLNQIANEFFLDNAGVGPELQYGGAAVTAGEFGTWAPIGAIQTAGGGYEVVWSLPGGNQYSIWTTDSSGNFVSQVVGLTGTSYALEAAESVLGQDLNGDGTIGLVKTLVQTDGSTSLNQIANEFFVDDNSGVGPALQYNGAPVVADEFAGWAPIGAVLTRDRKIIARGYNRRVQEQNVILHGEMSCMRNAGLIPFHDTVMYTTLSPCSMCAGAIGLFKLSMLVIGESVTFPGSKDILTQLGIPYIDLEDERSINMMKSWRSVPANERLWQGDIGN